MRQIAMVLLTVISGFVWACAHEPSPPAPDLRFPSDLAIQVRLYSHGRVIRSGHVKGSSAFYANLQSAIRGVNRWQFSVVDYAPILTVDAKSFNINVLRGIVVVNYPVSKSANAQVTGVINAGIYSRLVRLAIAVTKPTENAKR